MILDVDFILDWPINSFVRRCLQKPPFFVLWCARLTNLFPPCVRALLLLSPKWLIGSCLPMPVFDSCALLAFLWFTWRVPLEAAPGSDRDCEHAKYNQVFLVPACIQILCTVSSDPMPLAYGSGIFSRLFCGPEWWLMASHLWSHHCRVMTSTNKNTRTVCIVQTTCTCKY